MVKFLKGLLLCLFLGTIIIGLPVMAVMVLFFHDERAGLAYVIIIFSLTFARGFVDWLDTRRRKKSEELRIKEGRESALDIKLRERHEEWEKKEQQRKERVREAYLKHLKETQSKDKRWSRD
jgi:hypothetical protein